MPLMRRGPGLIGTAARTGVAMGVAGRVRHRQEQRWAEEEQAQYAQQAPPPAAAPAAPAAPDYAAELEQLAKLRDQGVISAEDFEAKKKQLLGI
ncbi:MAG TPA: SHOCT domain-containing protein [Rubrobacter sp.]|nr:SHOCT domain-containing protein [Rubrobacter sp.]